MEKWVDISIDDPRFEDETYPYYILGSTSRKGVPITLQLEVLDDEVNLYVDTMSTDNVQRLYTENDKFRKNHIYLELFSCYEVDSNRKWKRIARKYLDKQTITEIDRFIKTIK